MGALTEVLTVAEIAAWWHVCDNSVWYHLNRGRFRWRYTLSGRVLVERQSVVDYWGDVPCPFEVYEKLPD